MTQTAKNRVPMIRYPNPKQITLAEFETPFLSQLDENNRWVKLSNCIPWDRLAQSYYQNFTSHTGRPVKGARLVIGAVIIKHKLCLTDEETILQIQENPYLQYFVGLAGFVHKQPFAPSLLVEIRKRMGQTLFDEFQQAIIDVVAQKKQRPNPVKRNDHDDDPGQGPMVDESQQDLFEKESESVETPEAATHQGKLIIDATVAPQAIRYPTDLSLLNEAREISEKIIDVLSPETDLKTKPRTYRQKARKAFLSIAKQKRPNGKRRRNAIKQQLQYLRRNLKHINDLLDYFPQGQALPLSRTLLYRYWVIQHLYSQQQTLYQNKTRSCDHRIVSISQPYVRPIVRGKQSKPVEFGAKLSASLNSDGIACVDRISWDAYHEGQDVKAQVEAYRKRLGYYPEAVIADPAYGSRENRRYLKSKGIRYAGKALGRPKKQTAENKQQLKQEKAQRRADYLQRIPIEGKFGQGKNGYRLNYIRAKRADTSVAWINSIFLVMNLIVLLRLFFMLWKSVAKK